MGTSQDAIGLRARNNEPTVAAEIRDEWGRVSRERLGLSRQQWHHPATAHLVRAVVGGQDPARALTELGEARGGARLSLADTLADVAVLDELLPDVAVRLSCLTTAACVGAGWAGAFLGQTEPASCIDELTGLVTGEFLKARLEQIYRHCDYLGMRPCDAYALVVAQISGHEPSPFTRVAQRLRLAGDFRLTFPGSDTLAAFPATESTQTMLALTSRAPALPTAVDELSQGAGHRRVWVESLPATAKAAVELVGQLPDAAA